MGNYTDLTASMKLKSVVEDTDTKTGRYFDLFIQALIILSLISFSVSTVPDLYPEIITFLNYFQIFTVIIFTFEYLLRLYVADIKREYIFSIYGIIDFLAILPFYLSTAVDLRSLRILRLFRLFRILKFTRYTAAIERFKAVMKEIREELILFLSATAFLLYFAAVGIYYFENAAQPEQFTSIFHSLWWAVATLTTVGYGDVYPTTTGGKIFTFLILMIGLGIVAVPAGLLSDALKETKK